MTECERIVEEGILPAEFFKPEERCEFLVDEPRKKIWAVELDLLLQFDRVCREHGLRYFMAYGTLLGAVRHKGFIPWDDDIDLFMPRADYEKLMRLGDAFPKPYFLQTPYSDRGCAFSFLHLRNSNTTFFGEHRGYWGFNAGLFIDIFPLDNILPEAGDFVFDRIRELNEYASAYMKIPGYQMNDKGRRALRKRYGLSAIECYERITEIATLFNGRDTGYLSCNVSSLEPSIRENTNPASSFAETVLLDFEGFKFPAPVGYDGVLRACYGDYMQLPPPEKRIGNHAGERVDPDVPYRDFLKREGICLWE